MDDFTDDDMTQYAAQHAYKLSEAPTHAKELEIAQAWAPFRMWATILLHVWVRRAVGPPTKRT